MKMTFNGASINYLPRNYFKEGPDCQVQIKLQVEILRGQYDGHPNDIKISRLNGAPQIENSRNSLSNIRPQPKKTWQ